MCVAVVLGARWRMLKIASKKLTPAKAVVLVLPIKYHYSSQHHQRYSSRNIASSKRKPDEKIFELMLSLAFYGFSLVFSEKAAE